MTSSTGPGIGKSASPAIHRSGLGIRLSRARSFIARIVRVTKARTPHLTGDWSIRRIRRALGTADARPATSTARAAPNQGHGQAMAFSLAELVSGLAPMPLKP
jgi:hypothetical protein